MFSKTLICPAKHRIEINLLEGNKLLLFGDNKINVARKPGKKQMENPVGCTGKVKDEKEI